MASNLKVQMAEDIKAKTEILVDGYLRLLLMESDSEIFELPIDINHLCISFTYLPLKGVGQVIMWMIFHGALDQYIADGKLSKLFNVSSERKVQIATHCVENEVVSALKVIIDNVFDASSDLKILLAVSAIKHSSFGALSILLDNVTDNLATSCLFNVVKYKPHHRELIIFVMQKIGMLNDAHRCQYVAIKLEKANLLGTWEWIVSEFKDLIPNCPAAQRVIG